MVSVCSSAFYLSFSLLRKQFISDDLMKFKLMLEQMFGCICIRLYSYIVYAVFVKGLLKYCDSCGDLLLIGKS